METVSFINKGEIDLRAISHFGLHAKQTESAIGYFGTGLKYAISVLVRTGCKIEIFTGTARYTIGIRHDSFRDKHLDFVVSVAPDGREQDLGFTTELAKNWEIWAAYRELACNCYDEDGDVLDGRAEPEAGATTIVVTGKEFYDAYLSRADIILESSPFAHVSRMHTIEAELHTDHGHHIYYRGIRALALEAPSLYTYNITSRRELTEDRTLKFNPSSGIAQAWLTSTDKKLIAEVITADQNTFEGRMDFDWPSVPPSTQFFEVVEDMQKERIADINHSAIKACDRVKEGKFEPTLASLSAVEQSKVDKACDFVERHGYDVRRYPIVCVESLGKHTLACAYGDSIYLTRQLINMGGAVKLASALIEEYLHIRYDLLDETRELQTFLFEKLVSVYEEMDGEAL